MTAHNTYIWQKTNLHSLNWQDSALSQLLAEVNMLRGKLFGRDRKSVV